MIHYWLFLVLFCARKIVQNSTPREKALAPKYGQMSEYLYVLTLNLLVSLHF